MAQEGAADGLLAGLLPFQRRIVADLIDEDGLCILSAGMGWQKVVAVLLRLQMERLRDPAQHGAVLILGATDWQRQMVTQELLRIDPALAAAEAAAAASSSQQGRLPELPQEVTNETPAQARAELYQTKACLFITTRILVVDMLNGRIAGRQIAGIFVMNAHRVTDASQDGFAVRLFRQGNRAGFVRAFSDQATAFTGSFAKVEKVMRALFIRKLHLWPRFEATAKEVLDAVERDIQVVELEVFMTPAMTEIYNAIAELMDGCIKELRKSNRIDTSDLQVEAGLFRSFDDIVRRQLDAIWHTVSPRTKQIVADLRSLRTLAEHLLAFDPVTFLAYLDNLRVTEGVASIWLFHDAAHTVFEQAKRRVYHVQHGAAKKPRKAPAGKGACKGKGKGSANGGGEGSADEEGGAVAEAPAAAGTAVRAVLEPLPKWSLVQEIMEEVQKERAKLATEAASAGREPPEARVLIVALEARTCLQLRRVLAEQGSAAMLRQLYSGYLLRRLEGKKRSARSSSGSGGGGRGRGRGGRSSAKRLEQLRAQRLQGDRAEQEALLSAAQGVADERRGEGSGGGGGGRGGRGRGHGRKAGGKRARAAESPPPPEQGAPAETEAAAAAAAAAAADAPDAPLLAGVSFCALEGRDLGALWEVQPAFVVMYDPDIAFVRQLEVYKAERPGAPLRVYNLWYSDSLESDRYAVALEREQRVFEDLIRQKAYIVLPELEQDLRELEAREPREPPSSMHPDAVLGLPGGERERNPNALSRRGGARLALRGQAAPRRLVVDVREFMSSLPCVLYQQGLDLAPVTLEVGDYVLSPEICVERKSLPDLRQSLASGRLYAQAEAMCRHYRTPVLLIEFDRDRAFALHSAADISAEIQVNSLISKLVLLALHFPRLRLIWSRSLHASADIFRALKANQDEPDAAAAAAVGVPPAGEGGGEALVNTAAVDLLRRLPGVTEGNFRPLMAAAGSLAGLAAMPEAELAAVMGGQLAARKLRDWLDASCPRI